MLKWAVNSPRESYLHSVDNPDLHILHSPDQTIRCPNAKKSKLIAYNDSSIPHIGPEKGKRRRKSMDEGVKFRQEKENHLTSTPLHLSRSTTNSPFNGRRDSFRDLSNIVPENLCDSPKHLASCPSQSVLLKTPTACTLLKHTPSLNVDQKVSQHYSSTLPTFDVEYSPCGVVPGPILALRGIAIADSYFDKPRYLTQEQLNDNHQLNMENTITNNFINNVTNSITVIDKNTHESENVRNNTHKFDESSLTSSRIGDLTLERMIDAILESARKERKFPKNTKQFHRLSRSTAPVMSPTYTPADDPANDLYEFINGDANQISTHPKYNTRWKPPPGFNEREVRSPLVKQTARLKDDSQLCRQRAVRRKRKITQLTASVKNSAQKLLSTVGGTSVNIYNKNNEGVANDRSEYITQHLHEDSSSCKRVAETSKKIQDTSPDSGHNSSSDFDFDMNVDKNKEFSIAEIERNEISGNICLDATKRKLIFSANI